MGAWIKNTTVDNGIRCVSRHIDNFGEGASGKDLLSDFAPTNAGHDDIGQQEVDVTMMPFAFRNRLTAGVGGRKEPYIRTRPG